MLWGINQKVIELDDLATFNLTIHSFLQARLVTLQLGSANSPQLAKAVRQKRLPHVVER
ncbi:unnamed protein product [Protopolystoma xenopodis]|uniref:Uncharacterized protein n=1 Tax=Protopolystoma xenopodis TaxID=117903 RepID=A0A3S5CLM3_9PLAT|nr:unnamed protein product [Protopolystoma xenopodis]